MTLNSLDVRTDQGATLTLLLSQVTNGYSIQDIEGLDPVPANIVSSSFARQSGEQFQSARREKRNLIFRIGLEADYTALRVKDLREELYKFFTPPKGVNFTFHADDYPSLSISGKVETFDCPIFVREPVATISVICFDPDFTEEDEIEVIGATVADTTMSTLDYEGTIDTGIIFEIQIDRTLSAFTIYHAPEGEAATSMAVVGSFFAGDVVRISTIPGNKYVQLTRASVVSSILHTLSPYSDWVSLQPGNNEYRVQAEGAPVPYSFTYTNKHGGL